MTGSTLTVPVGGNHGAMLCRYCTATIVTTTRRVGRRAVPVRALAHEPRCPEAVNMSRAARRALARGYRPAPENNSTPAVGGGRVVTLHHNGMPSEKERSDVPR